MQDNSYLDQLMRFQSHDAILVCPISREQTLHNQFIAANDTAAQMLGYSQAELLGITPMDILADKPTNEQQLKRQLLETGGVSFERSLRTSGGERIPVEVRVHTLDHDDMTVAVCLFRDISERKRNEQERALNEERFRTLYALSRMLDRTEKEIIDFATEESVRLTGSAVGYVYLVSPDERFLSLHAATNGAQPGRIEDFPGTCGVCDTGFWCEAVRQRQPVIINDVAAERHLSLPVFDDERIVMVAGVGSKAEPYTESDVVQLSVLMDGMWRIIQRKRMEKDLILARAAAEKANEVKSQFLANMSHELRTPLNGIMGMTQILLGTDITPAQKEYLDLSLEATRHLNKIVNDLLSLSTVEKGAVELVRQEFDLRETLESLLKPIREQAHNKGLSVSLAVDDDAPSKLYGDMGKLRQVLLNILFNAIKFTKRGSISLDVSSRDDGCGEDGDSAALSFIVRDTGIGIPKELHESIFESFTLGEDYMTKQFGGTGLGLSISRRLAAIMGGTISVESTLGQGSSFRLDAPFTVLERKTGPATCVDVADEPTRPLHVLLAEDEQVNSIMAARLLKNAGHSVTIAGNGQQALDHLARETFDIVLMDVQMPILNGLETTQIIRSGGVEGVPDDLPIIGLTAFAQDEEKQRFLDAGMQQIVTKPYEADELMRAIARTLRG